MNERWLLSLDALLLALWVAAASLGSWALFYLGLPVLGVIVWFGGGLRFARTRRFLRESGRAIGQLVRLRRPSNQALRNLAIAAGVLVLLLVLNQMPFMEPLKGRGLSVPTSGLTTGGGFVAAFWGIVLLLFVAAVWWRLWKPVATTDDAWRKRLILACLALFLLLPGPFYAWAEFGGPEDPEENAKLGTLVMRTLAGLLSLCVAIAVAVPLWRPSRAPVVRPAVAAPVQRP